MDGDVAPMVELVKLRKEHDFLLVIDDVSPLGQAMKKVGPRIKQKNLYEMEITLFCYLQPITVCHMKNSSRVTYCDWPEIAK